MITEKHPNQANTNTNIFRVIQSDTTEWYLKLFERLSRTAQAACLSGGVFFAK